MADPRELKFQPRDEYEREAFEIEPPTFDLGEQVTVLVLGEPEGQGIITDIYLRTVNLPCWLYQVDGGEAWHDVWTLKKIDG